MLKYTYAKKERLAKRKSIENVFQQGNTFNVFPIKFKWRSISISTNEQTEVGVAVSAKMFKRAVDRNLLKRRMREAYRLNKSELCDLFPSEIAVHIMMIYMAKDHKPYAEIEKAVQKGLKTVSKLKVKS